MNMTPIQDRARQRLATIKGSPADAPTPEPEPVSTPRPAPAPAAKPRGLGPNQLAWLRDNVTSFETCERLALAAEDHRRQMLEAVRA